MNREAIKKEAKKWSKQGIITEQQLDEIVDLYPKRDRSFLLLTFAALFIGLGFLTFIASNWSWIPQIGKMTIILLFMIGFYVSGELIYRKKSKPVGLSFIVIGLFVFGAGIFLTGQMYNYMYFQAIPFLIWSLAGVALFIFYQHASLYVVSIVITTVGQLYSAFVYSDFNLGLFLVLLFAFGHYTYRQARYLYGYLFAISFMVQTMVLVFADGHDYYWLIIGSLVLYGLGSLVRKQGLNRPFRHVSLIAMFILGIFHVFLLGNSYFLDSIEFELIFLAIWIIILIPIVVMKTMKQEFSNMIELALFVPVFFVPYSDLLAMLVLFIYSLGMLLIGYKEEHYRKITLGTFAFLISTLIAYIHLAWAFLNKSLFFFLGGIILFILSFLLERKRREHKQDARGGNDE
ncbi:DUF2157 domain-containing protein [Aquibacillus halophilus]|uniref:DUF2157 domain-containing protein n=1 Tax=Aquibacillus halophilus TaxID=930132 RepID=A0A6A8DKA2_9BACI|nr:DUF2157 domain-containing protein [Aquibacillus halophilus]MRH44189.1 DUF2157 domain-containing protein [Aquibacillus halophilus]